MKSMIFKIWREHMHCVLGQSFECQLNCDAQILVQKAQCRFLCRFIPLIISHPVPSPISATSFSSLPSLSLSLPICLLSHTPTISLFSPPLSPQFLSDSSIPSLSTSIDYCLTNHMLPLYHPHSFSFLPPSPPISSPIPLFFSLKFNLYLGFNDGSECYV